MSGMIARVRTDQDGRILGPVLLFAPLAILSVCLAQKFGFIVLPQGLRAGMVFVLLLSLMLTGMPISIALGLTVLTFLFTLTSVPIESVALKLFTGIEKFEIMAIPFFILAGNFLTHGGVARRMIAFATSMVGHYHGGLGLAAVLACALFAAVSGSSPATVVAIGSVIMPAMVAQGFPPRFGAGVVTTAGALGILIPPSIAMVIYAVSTNSSIGQLFMAGVIPGIMLATMLGMTTWYRAWKNNYPRLPKATMLERVQAFRNASWGLFLIVIVIGGIYSGMFTPTEAAAMSAVYAFFIAVFVYRDIGLRDVPRILLSSANMSAMLLYIITNAVLFSFLMTHENIPQAMADWIIAPGLRLDLVPAGGQCPAAARRQRDGAVVDHPDHGADPVPGRREARHRPDPLRHPDHGEHGSRPVPSAGGPQPLRGLRHRQDGHNRAHSCGLAVAADDARIPGHSYLLAGLVVVAADGPRHAMMPPR